jgi:hypothetical protein
VGSALDTLDNEVWGSGAMRGAEVVDEEAAFARTSIRHVLCAAAFSLTD